METIIRFDSEKPVVLIQTNDPKIIRKLAKFKVKIEEVAAVTFFVLPREYFRLRHRHLDERLFGQMAKSNGHILPIEQQQGA